MVFPPTGMKTLIIKICKLIASRASAHFGWPRCNAESEIMETKPKWNVCEDVMAITGNYHFWNYKSGSPARGKWEIEWRGLYTLCLSEIRWKSSLGGFGASLSCGEFDEID